MPAKFIQVLANITSHSITSFLYLKFSTVIFLINFQMTEGYASTAKMGTHPTGMEMILDVHQNQTCPRAHPPYPPIMLAC